MWLRSPLLRGTLWMFEMQKFCSQKLPSSTQCFKTKKGFVFFVSMDVLLESLFTEYYWIRLKYTIG
jgi:hypothetical protein